MKRILCVIALAGWSFAMAAGIAHAAPAKDLGLFKKWQAVSFDENGKTGCYMSSDATKSEGNYTSRNRVYAFVTHRPAENSFDTVTFVAGYTFKPGSEVTLEIDKKKFTLFTDTDKAWAPDADTDRKIVDAMKKGSNAIIRGMSSRGTETKDTYSLSGFTGAYNAIGKACKR